MARSLSSNSLASVIANAITADEVAAIARQNIGTAWTANGCTDFVWGVTALAGAPFFDLRGAAILQNGDPLLPLDIDYIVPHSWNANQPGDKWTLVSHGSSASAIISTLQVGDVVRAYRDATETTAGSGDLFVGHEFIVSKIDASGTWAVDNTGAGGSISHYAIIDPCSELPHWDV